MKQHTRKQPPLGTLGLVTLEMGAIITFFGVLLFTALPLLDYLNKKHRIERVVSLNARDAMVKPFAIHMGDQDAWMKMIGQLPRRERDDSQVSELTASVNQIRDELQQEIHSILGSSNMDRYRIEVQFALVAIAPHDGRATNVRFAPRDRERNEGLFFSSHAGYFQSPNPGLTLQQEIYTVVRGTSEGPFGGVVYAVPSALFGVPAAAQYRGMSHLRSADGEPPNFLRMTLLVGVLVEAQLIDGIWRAIIENFWRQGNVIRVGKVVPTRQEF